jgi:hypothetical protein
LHLNPIPHEAAAQMEKVLTEDLHQAADAVTVGHRKDRKLHDVYIQFQNCMYVKLDPNEIRTLNNPVNVELLDNLVMDMKENGWRGRSLLVIETELEYVAWTGSHRIAAAIEAGLATVPCYLLPVRKLTESGFKNGCWHVSNAERVDIVSKTRDGRAIELMEQE